MLKSVEPSPAEHSGEGEAKKHGVQEDEATDCCIRVFAKNHQGYEPNSWSLEVHLPSSIVGQRNGNSAEECVERSHNSVVELIGVFLSGLEFEGAIVTCQVSRKSNQHLSKGRVNIEIELALQVVRAEFAKTREVVRIV